MTYRPGLQGLLVQLHLSAATGLPGEHPGGSRPRTPEMQLWHHAVELYRRSRRTSLRHVYGSADQGKNE